MNRSQQNLPALLIDYVDYKHIRILKNKYNSPSIQRLFEFTEAIQLYRSNDAQNAIFALNHVISKTQDRQLKKAFLGHGIRVLTQNPFPRLF